MPSCYLGWSELVSGSAFGILLNPRVVSFSCSSSLLRRRCIRPAHFASKLAISEPNSVDCLLCSWFLSYFVFWICSIPHKGIQSSASSADPLDFHSQSSGFSPIGAVVGGCSSPA